MSESEKLDMGNSSSETLTDADRATAERAIAELQGPRTSVLAKLLRIHDQQAVTIANLEHRLALVTADPESLSASLLSKHNALRMASENLDAQAARIRELEAQMESVRSLAETGRVTSGAALANAILDVVYAGRQRP